MHVHLHFHVSAKLPNSGGSKLVPNNNNSNKQAQQSQPQQANHNYQTTIPKVNVNPYLVNGDRLIIKESLRMKIKKMKNIIDYNVNNNKKQNNNNKRNSNNKNFIKQFKL